MNPPQDPDSIDYPAILEQAMRNAVRDILQRTVQYGPIGEHYFYITFAITHPDVDIPAYLRETYHNEMTIILQYQFWDLEVTETYFHVALNFNRKKESLIVPFASLLTFSDPSVNFSLNFRENEPETLTLLDKEPFMEEAENTKTDQNLQQAPPFRKLDTKNKTSFVKEKKDPKKQKKAKIIAIDHFRKK